jgi:hypothetical protein
MGLYRHGFKNATCIFYIMNNLNISPTICYSIVFSLSLALMEKGDEKRPGHLIDDLVFSPVQRAGLIRLFIIAVRF